MDYKTRKALDLCLREEYSLAYPRPHLALDAPRILTPCLPPQAVGFLVPLSFQMQGSRAHNTGAQSRCPGAGKVNQQPGHWKEPQGVRSDNRGMIRCLLPAGCQVPIKHKPGAPTEILIHLQFYFLYVCCILFCSV